MRRTIAFTALLLAERSSAFSIPSNTQRFHTALSAAAEGTKKPPSAAEILAKVNKAAGIEEEEFEMLFDDALLDDMQQCLLTLEKRVRDGPGSIALLEIEQFQAMAANIVNDMKKKEDERLNTLASGSAPPASQQLKAATVVVEAAPAPPAVQATKAPPSKEGTEKVVGDSEDDGPAYDGQGGMGLAKGTANTWIIDGMDSMSPEEYQVAIQASISARQAKRKESGVYGNRTTNDYLNNLSGKNRGGMLK